MIHAIQYHTKPSEDGLHSHPHVLKHARICVSNEPRQLVYPGMEAEPKLRVDKEDGIVRGFSYRCSCGRTDHFRCE